LLTNALPVSAQPQNARGAEVTDQSVREPVQGNVQVRLEANDTSAFLELIDPPDGKMVVINYVTIRSFSESDDANALLSLIGAIGTDAVVHFMEPLPPPFHSGIVTGKTQTVQRSLLLYSTEPVRSTIQRGSFLKGTIAIFNVSFSGYLVNAPR